MVIYLLASLVGVDSMQTELGIHLKQHIPDIEIQEDVFDSDHYWLAIRLGEAQWISVEAFSEGGFGVSITGNGELDLGSHDLTFDNPLNVFRYIEMKLATTGHA